MARIGGLIFLGLAAAGLAYYCSNSNQGEDLFDYAFDPLGNIRASYVKLEELYDRALIERAVEDRLKINNLESIFGNNP